MRKAIIAAAALAFVTVPLLAAGQAQAKCLCPGSGADYDVCMATGATATGPAVCDSPQQAPPTVEATQPQAPVSAPAQAPSINPPTIARPSTAPTTQGAPTGKTVALPVPKDVTAPADAVQAARNAPPATVDPANPPPAAGKPVDVATTVQQNSQLTVQHWGFVDYDTDHHPVLFNPVGADMTFRYFYEGSYRDVYVPAGGRVVLTTAIVGVFPFTAVGAGYLTSGYFNGGAADPVVFGNVNVHVNSVNTTLMVNRVTVVGHDADAPQGRQDTMMLDGTTLARGQVNQATDGGAVDLVAAQSTPGVGPWDNGASIVNTALQASSGSGSCHLVAAGVLIGVLALAGAALVWVGLARRAKRPQQPAQGVSS
jgi:hypothetical protein